MRTHHGLPWPGVFALNLILPLPDAIDFNQPCWLRGLSNSPSSKAQGSLSQKSSALSDVS